MILSALFVVALAVRVAVAWQQEWPGYLDATYYTIVARSLAEGRGLSEDLLWNYVDRPAALPPPSNAHWMPLTSFVAAPFLRLFGDDYRAAQIPFVVLSAALVPLVYAVSLKMFGRRRWALVSAALALGGGTYFPHWTSVDAWSLYPWIGAAILGLGASATNATPGRRAFLAAASGAAVGLGHLTRADGLLLFAPVAVLFLHTPARVLTLGAAGLGYLAVMGPWLLRNVRAFGRPLLGSHLVWLRDYNDLFAFEKDIAAEPWTASDWIGRITGAFHALGLNVASLAGALEIVFLPLLVVALWTERRRPVVRAATAYLLTLLLVMSFVFTLPGPRGTFLHSLAAVIVLFYALAPAGLSRVVEWVAKRRSRWDAAEAERFFAFAFLAMGAVVCANAYVATASWYRPPTSFAEIERALRRRGEPADTPVFCIDAAACHYWMGRPALMIPMDGDAALCRAASRFGARHLVLEDNHPQFLERLYASPESDPRFEHVGAWRDAEGHPVHAFRFVACPPEAC